MKKLIIKPLLKGSLVVFPILITIWVIWSLVRWIDDLGQKALEPFLLDHLIFPGSGLIIVLALLFLVGVLFQFNYINWVFTKVEKYMLKFPLVKTVYSAMKDLAGMFDNDQNNDQQVVLVDMQSVGLGFVVGMITNKNLPSAINNALSESLSHSITTENAPHPAAQAASTTIGSDKIVGTPMVAVYLPMSYMVGGYTIVVENSKVKPIDWSFEEAMRFALTAGVSQKPESFAEKMVTK